MPKRYLKGMGEVKAKEAGIAPNEFIDKMKKGFPKTRAMFMDAISDIESSGGKDFSHREIASGIQKGTSAGGQYGLMPNTIKELVNRSKSEDLAPIAEKNPDEIKQLIESNPDIEDVFAKQLSDMVIKKSDNNLDKAAYMWNQGHNLDPDSVSEDTLAKSDYVEKFRNLMEKLQRGNK